MPNEPESIPPELHVPLPPTTTLQEDITRAGQRKINLVWEYTQASIALIVVMATMAASLLNVIGHATEQVPTILAVAFGTVVGFYFGRTNHVATGGIGVKPVSLYNGR